MGSRWAQDVPKRLQEAPRGSQEAPRASQDVIFKASGPHFGRFFVSKIECSSIFLDLCFAFRSCVCPGPCVSYLRIHTLKSVLYQLWWRWHICMYHRICVPPLPNLITQIDIVIVVVVSTAVAAATAAAATTAVVLAFVVVISNYTIFGKKSGYSIRNNKTKK